jgi:hypothetical protein
MGWKPPRPYYGSGSPTRRQRRLKTYSGGPSVAAAATFQQAYVSAIVELLIAAVLALPELLRTPQSREPRVTSTEAPQHLPTALEAEKPEILPASPPNRTRLRIAVPAITAPAATSTNSDAEEIDPKPVVAFFAKHVPPARGGRADWADIYGGFLASQTDGNSLSAAQFGAVLRHICEQADIRVRRQGDRVYCVDRCFTWEA